MNSNGYVCVWEGLLQAAGDAGARSPTSHPAAFGVTCAPRSLGHVSLCQHICWAFGQHGDRKTRAVEMNAFHFADFKGEFFNSVLFLLRLF